MIKVQSLSKSFGTLQALTDVSFQVALGDVIGLLGPNGAGKTTLMRILTGFLQPDTGSATVDGIDVMADPGGVQAAIGYLPENAPLYPELTVQGYLQLMADLRGLTGPGRFARLAEAVYSTGLEERLTQPIGELSKGFRQRVGLAQAVLHRPKVLILDEPTNGLDPTQIQEVRRLIRRLAGPTTIVLSTHILSEVEATCDRAVIIINGRIRADARLSELARSANAVIGIAKPPGDVEGVLRGHAGVAAVERVALTDDRTRYRVIPSDGRDLCPGLYDLARTKAWSLVELRHEERTLEHVFNELAIREGGVTV